MAIASVGSSKILLPVTIPQNRRAPQRLATKTIVQSMTNAQIGTFLLSVDRINTACEAVTRSTLNNTIITRPTGNTAP